MIMIFLPTMERSNQRHIFSDNKIECPFCGSGTVLATVLTSFRCVKEHPMYKDDVNIDGETMEQAYGTPSEPSMRFTSFRCTSCGKRWLNSQYKVVQDDDGICTFVKNDKSNKAYGADKEK